MLMSDMGQGVGRGVTSDQVIIMAANVIKKQSKPLEVKGLRGRARSEKRERTVVEQSRLTAGGPAGTAAEAVAVTRSGPRPTAPPRRPACRPPAGRPD
jgi:hypothetical protein